MKYVKTVSGISEAVQWGSEFTTLAAGLNFVTQILPSRHTFSPLDGKDVCRYPSLGDYLLDPIDSLSQDAASTGQSFTELTISHLRQVDNYL